MVLILGVCQFFLLVYCCCLQGTFSFITGWVFVPNLAGLTPCFANVGTTTLKKNNAGRVLVTVVGV